LQRNQIKISNIMRKNFNFKAEWAVAIQMLSADMRLCVYQIILTMGLHDVSLDNAIATNGVTISDSDALNLLINVEKILTSRRRARERAAARRLARATETRGNNTSDITINDSTENTTDDSKTTVNTNIESETALVNDAIPSIPSNKPSSKKKHTRNRKKRFHHRH